MGGVAWNTGYPDPSPRRGKGPIISPPQGPAEHNTLSVLLVSVFLFKEKKQKFPSFFIGGAFPPPNPPSHYYWGAKPPDPLYIGPFRGPRLPGALEGPPILLWPLRGQYYTPEGVTPEIDRFFFKKRKIIIS